jgi:hypothetical protein
MTVSLKPNIELAQSASRVRKRARARIGLAGGLLSGRIEFWNGRICFLRLVCGV